MICSGIDAGSRAIKGVLFDTVTQRIVASHILDQGVHQTALARSVFERMLKQAGLPAEQVAYTVATGYGRGLVDFAQTTVTEITCHACGVRFLEPEARTIVEIGGQDSKLIRLEARDGVRDFAMNDRCAAGTGRFLEMVAARLNVGVVDLGSLARQSTRPATISSMCVVFAETEITGLLATGTSPADIVAGVQASIASRISAMAGREMEAPVVFTGGVALIPGMAEALGKVLKRSVKTVSQPLLTGALGAAILAGRRKEKSL